MAEVSDRGPLYGANVRTRSGNDDVEGRDFRGFNGRLMGAVCVGLLIALNVLVAREALVLGWKPFVITILIGGAFCVPLFAVSRQTRGTAQGDNHVDKSKAQALSSSAPTAPRDDLAPQLARDVYIELEWRLQTAGQTNLPADISHRVGNLLEMFAFLTGEFNSRGPLRIDQALVVMRNMPTSVRCDLSIVAALEAVLLARQVDTYAAHLTGGMDRYLASCNR